MRGDAQPPRMGDAMAVHQHQVGGCGQPAQRDEHGGQLAKGQQAGDVRHAGRQACHDLVERVQGRRIEQDRHRAGDRPALLEADVDTGDAARLGPGVLQAHPGREFDLQRARACDITVPGRQFGIAGMRIGGGHRRILVVPGVH